MLSPVIGELLPLTLAIAVSPLTIVAVILMLLSPNARRTGPGFLIGWTLGVTIPVVVFVLIASALPSQGDSDGPDVTRAVVQFVLAALLLLLAVVQWRRRPQAGEEPALPKWMAAIDSFTFGRALGLGLLLSVPRPKNLLVAASASVIIAGAGVPIGSEVVAIAVFVLCAVSTVLVPVVAFLVAAGRLRQPMEALRRWLARENVVITTVLLVVIGVLMLGKGIGSL
ncbi:GAP family protein [Microbacterium sp. cx-59]|uniref:GAP family protein n=1 Tax=Microbacterium sp. cx-59 TaxID=2891207 RepID=UPI001E5CC695|nr:GAP family protein [Microbacterium sp. cx-59]MCC4908113.1 GAP family protein [Microbacterium sp. cx-59]